MNNKIVPILICLSVCGSAMASPAAIDPVNVFVTNDANAPVAVKVVPSVSASVVCSLSIGTTSAGVPRVIGGGGGIPLRGISCPDGVQKIDLQRIAFTPDFGAPITPGAAEGSSSVASWRVTVVMDGYPVLSNPTDLRRTLAVVTDGSPVTDVFQSVVLDLSDTTDSLDIGFFGTTGLDSQNGTMTGYLLFIGKPVQ